MDDGTKTQLKTQRTTHNNPEELEYKTKNVN